MVESARTADLPPGLLYAILALRSQVFVVEQECAYLDLDGRDVEPGCVQLWVAGDDGEVVATARLLDEAGGHRFGRLCTSPVARSAGLGGALVREGLRLAGSGPVVIDAQSHLAGWYGTFGYEPTGHAFVEDGIHHTEMRVLL